MRRGYIVAIAVVVLAIAAGILSFSIRYKQHEVAVQQALERLRSLNTYLIVTLYPSEELDWTQNFALQPAWIEDRTEIVSRIDEETDFTEEFLNKPGSTYEDERNDLALAISAMQGVRRILLEAEDDADLEVLGDKVFEQLANLSVAVDSRLHTPYTTWREE